MAGLVSLRPLPRLVDSHLLTVSSYELNCMILGPWHSLTVSKPPLFLLFKKIKIFQKNFFRIFFMCAVLFFFFLKVLKFVTLLLLFYVLVFWPRGMWVLAP